MREPFLVQRPASRGIDRRPLQWQADVGEICAAYRTGGEALANRSYRAIVEARGLMQWTALALGEDVRKVLKDIGLRS